MKVRDAHGNNIELLTRNVGDAHAPMHGRLGRAIVASGTKTDATFHDADPKILKVAFEHVWLVNDAMLALAFSIGGHTFELRPGEMLSEAFRGPQLAYSLTPEASAEVEKVIAWNEAHEDEEGYSPRDVPTPKFRFILSR